MWETNGGFRWGRQCRGSDAFVTTRPMWVSRLITLLDFTSDADAVFLVPNACELDVGCRYRAVVFGWDRRCRGSGSWVAKNQANPEQPYYYCLPDEGDAQRRPARGRHMQHTSMQPMPWQCLRSLATPALLQCCLLGTYMPCS